MDYVVFGTGYGATLMLLGWILRTFGPDFRYRLEDDSEPPGGDFILARMSWRRFSAGLGALIATAGMMIVFITFVLILINPDNSTGTWVLVASLAFVLIGAAAWSWLYVGRYGTFGIVPAPKAEDEVFRSPGEAVPEPAMTNAAAHGTDLPVAGSGPLPVGVADGNDLFAGPDDADDDVMAERQIRMSRYQSHGPGPTLAREPDEVPAGETMPDTGRDEAFADVDEPAEDDSSHEEDTVAERDEGDLRSAEESSEGDHDPGDVVAAEVPEVEADVDDVPSDVETSQDDAPLVADDERSLLPGESEPDATRTLEDTPEARAEALRRIQSWNPDDPDQS